MATNIKYIGRRGFDQGYSGLICEKHNVTEIATYVYQLEEIECSQCWAEWDKEREEWQARRDMIAGLGHPSICLCHTCAPGEEEWHRFQEEEMARWNLAEILSPGFCDHLVIGFFGCSRKDCPHPGCMEERNTSPF